jgi:hypothetical protein
MGDGDGTPPHLLAQPFLSGLRFVKKESDTRDAARPEFELNIFRFVCLPITISSNSNNMDNKDINPDEEPLSNDPEENLRMENELLKLKIRAEFGGIPGEMGAASLPPEIENAFLKNVLAFERHQGDFKPQLVREILGNPSFEKSNNLTPENFQKEYQRLTELLQDNSIEVDFVKDREDRFKYQFITEELFEHKMESRGLPGMTNHFIYEEFHPDHDYDIRERTNEFLDHWFKREFDNQSMELGHSFVLANGQMLSREEALAKIQTLFDCYTSFKNCKFVIFEVKHELYEETDSGMGHAEGAVKFEAVLENGESVFIEGQFKLYLSYEYGWWSICYFVFPGFEW